MLNDCMADVCIPGLREDKQVWRAYAESTYVGVYALDVSRTIH